MQAEALTLREAPDWAGAAQLLIDGCAHADGAAERIELLERLCDALGDQLYPAFLKVLCVVATHGTDAAQAAVAQALVDGLASGRVPSGRRPAWGAPPSWTGGGPAGRGGQALGPVEYLCAWYVQAEGPVADRREAFSASLGKLLGLLSRSQRAREGYAARLCMVADDPIGGALSRDTRAGLRALAQAWQDGSAYTLTAATQAFMAAVAGGPGQGAGAPTSAPGRPAAPASGGCHGTGRSPWGRCG
ncbi:hypothetical protein MW290_00790 [Aquincola tertiaricarbonis]|uniref:Uncharacterized protein n=1 Tax=Aquincola tertiaricarbonis TaxID=391953 RepID=A0ABY4S3D5_AQUTE|nr:hypothetical protein [Aquincola tertiaricarbonis]URI07195.1 hypothetical protein MW290_00790 [Aquincola tertiaricarbonis]